MEPVNTNTYDLRLSVVDWPLPQAQPAETPRQVQEVENATPSLTSAVPGQINYLA